MSASLDMHVGRTEEEFGARFASGDWARVGGSIQSLGFAMAAVQVIYENADELLRHFARAGSLLDFGCALGDGTAVLAAHFPMLAVTGADISAAAVAAASKRWPTLSFVRDDIENPQLSAGVIWTSHTLEHLKSPAAVVQRLLERCDFLVAQFPPIEEHQEVGPHIGAPLASEWLPTLPEPLFTADFLTRRLDATMSHMMLEEDNRLCVWRGTLKGGT